MHVHDHGIFQFCVSDLGSQIKAGASTISSFLNDVETRSYLESNGIKNVTFQQYAKGNSSLGSLVESLVKQVKFLVYKSIRMLILDYFEFEFLISKSVSLINKRPIAFRQGLSSLDDDAPDPITPEMLIRGYNTCTVNVIPSLAPTSEDPDYAPPGTARPNDAYDKLSLVRERLIGLYHSEFLASLMHQSIDKARRYVPVPHRQLSVGDIVLLVEEHFKRYHYPMGRVTAVDRNSLGEVTAAHVLKGNTRERVYRHATSLILLLPAESVSDADPSGDTPDESVQPGSSSQRPTRAAAKVCASRLRDLAAADAI